MELNERQKRAIELLNDMTFTEVAFALQHVSRVVRVEYAHPTIEDRIDDCIEVFEIRAILAK